MFKYRILFPINTDDAQRQVNHRSYVLTCKMMILYTRPSYSYKLYIYIFAYNHTF